MVRRMVIACHTSPLSCFGKSQFTINIYHTIERKDAMSVKRIKINPVEEMMLEEIKSKEKLSNEELFNQMIRTHYEKIFSNKQESEIGIDILNELKEYILLLIKNSPTLPTDAKEMAHLVMSSSRFENPVREKINEKKLSSEQ